jgi:hypothetical protein
MKYRVIVFNATFNNISVISCRSVLLVEKTGVPRENHQPVVSHWQTLSMLYRVHLIWAGLELTTLVGIGTDWIGSCKSNYHMIITPWYSWNTAKVGYKHLINYPYHHVYEIYKDISKKRNEFCPHYV